MVGKDGWNDEACGTRSFASLDDPQDRSDEKSVFFPLVVLSHPPVLLEPREPRLSHLEIVSDDTPLAMFREPGI